MKPLPQDRFVIGSYQYMRYPLDFFLDTAARLGYKYLDLWAAAPQLFPPALDRQARNVIRRETAARHLEIYCITPETVAYPFNLGHQDETLRRMGIDYCKSCVDLACDLGAPYILTAPGCGFFNEDHEVLWRRSVDSNRELAEYAKNRGIGLFFETLTPPSSNILNTPQQLAQMLSELPGNVGGLADFGQIAFMKQQLADYTAVLGKKLAHVHVQDSGEAIHMALGEGVFPVAESIAFLEENGYEGRYGLEINDPRYRKDPAAADEKSLRWLREYGVIA
jgi:protein FrlC